MYRTMHTQGGKIGYNVITE